MSRKSRFQEVRAAKDRRAKKMAIGGAVVLAAVLAFEIPHVLNRGSHSTSPPPATTTTSTTAPGTTAPGTAAGATATPTGAPAVLPNSDVAPSRSRSQLFSFSHFTSKDPFVQQVQDVASGQSSAQGAGATGTITADAAGTQQSATAVTTSSVRTLATTGTARISINGRAELVRVGKSFPSSNPLFRLVSISHGVVKIGIANGSYTSGAQTVTLAAGRPLTLVDTADGVRYKIQLLAAS
jgi:hypothetical protein